MHSDPIADMLTRIREGSRAHRARINIPFSRLKLSIAELLYKEGFIGGVRELTQVGADSLCPKFARKHQGPAGHMIEVKLKYDEVGEPVILQIKRMSTPGLRRYYDCDSLPKVLGGLGVVVLTTSKGLMTDREARKARLGGEALCSVC